MTQEHMLAGDADGSLRGTLRDEAATLVLGERIAACIEPGMKIYLDGDLGAGKTTLVRGILRGMGYAGRVKSPTFTLLETYNLSSLYLYHFDFYRLKNPDEWRDAGFREAFGSPGAVCVVEWPEKAAGLPRPDLAVHMEHVGPNPGRRVRVRSGTARGERCLCRLAD